MADYSMEKTFHIKGKIAVICGSLGHLYNGEYLIEPDCLEGIKDLIRLLKKDDGTHVGRRSIGEINVVQNHLIHIIKSCPSDMPDLFNVTLRLLANITIPAVLLYGQEVPQEKTQQHIYLTLVSHDQNYKIAFADIEFWHKICCKLTTLFEIDWTERTTDNGIEIERILTIVRNVLQIPATADDEKRSDTDTTNHDKVLCALRQSQILELLLMMSSNKNEESYYLNLLEIFSYLLREQNPKILARCDLEGSEEEKNKDMEELLKARQMEKSSQKKYSNTRNFKSTFIMRGIKSIADKDIICHKSLDKIKVLGFDENPKAIRRGRNKIAVESGNLERRSTYSIRLFLKEFCLEFINSSFQHFMTAVKNYLDSGKCLPHDQTYYFWAVSFFLEFAIESNVNVELIKNCLTIESFHFVQTNMDLAFEYMYAEKKKSHDWVKRIHMILKAYNSLLETLIWMDCSKNPLIRALSREIKSDVFYVVEYREMILHLIQKFESNKFPLSYLRDLIHTTHIFIKLLDEYSKQTKFLVQKVTRKKKLKKKKSKEKKDDKSSIETKEEKWDKLKDDVYDTLVSENNFPEIPPFDAALDVPIDDQKGRAMKNIQELLHKGDIKKAIGLLRSARQVWPENNYFGSNEMMAEDETMALQEICLANLESLGDLKNTQDKTEKEKIQEVENEEKFNQIYGDEDDDKGATRIVEQDFDIMDYKKRLVHKKVVEICGILLKNYKRNSDHTNHCALKLLHRIGWECSMPAMLYQASLFWTLLKIMNDTTRNYSEINNFTINLMRKFRKHSSLSDVVFLELLFWKDHGTAVEIQHGYVPYERPAKASKKKKKGIFDEDNLEEKISDEEASEDVLTALFEEKENAISENRDQDLKKISRKNKSKNKRERKRRTPKSKAVQEVLNEGNLNNESVKSPKLNKSGCTSNEPLSFSGEGSSDSDVRVNSKIDQSDGSVSDIEAIESKSSARIFRDSKDDNKNPPFYSVAYKRRRRKENSELLHVSNESSKETTAGKTDQFNLRRPRFIGSDSDPEEFQSDDENFNFSKKARIRRTVIDSDSDMEEDIKDDVTNK